MGTGQRPFLTYTELFSEMEAEDWSDYRWVRKLIREGKINAGHELHHQVIIGWLQEKERRENLRQCLYYGM